MESTFNIQSQSKKNTLDTSMTMVSGASRAHAVRFSPGADLVSSLEKAAVIAMGDASTSSAYVITAVGSLSEVTLRMAATDNEKAQSSTERKDQYMHTKRRKSSESLAESTSLQVVHFEDHFEVVSLVGTFSADGGKHLHMSISNRKGEVIGGHLVAGTVFTTLELVLGTIQDVNFSREMDADTGYKELSITILNGN